MTFSGVLRRSLRVAKTGSRGPNGKSSLCAIRRSRAAGAAASRGRRPRSWCRGRARGHRQLARARLADLARGPARRRGERDGPARCPRARARRRRAGRTRPTARRARRACTPSCWRSRSRAGADSRTRPRCHRPIAGERQPGRCATRPPMRPATCHRGPASPRVRRAGRAALADAPAGAARGAIARIIAALPELTRDAITLDGGGGPPAPGAEGACAGRRGHARRRRAVVRRAGAGERATRRPRPRVGATVPRASGLDRRPMTIPATRSWPARGTSRSGCACS